MSAAMAIRLSVLMKNPPVRAGCGETLSVVNAFRLSGLRKRLMLARSHRFLRLGQLCQWVEMIFTLISGAVVAAFIVWMSLWIASRQRRLIMRRWRSRS